MSEGSNRGPRRDAVRNRELLLDSAQRLFGERGTKVSSAAITEGAGLAAGTLYRHFPTREDLLAALSERSFRIALEHAREADEGGRPAPEALLAFLERTIARREELMMLPMHGGPLPLGDSAKESRTEIRVALDRVLARGREEQNIRLDVSANDVILMGALLAQSLPNAPDWDAAARRQAKIYVAGLHPSAGPPLGERDPGREDLEKDLKPTASRR
jgi:AcrR family transcriptional regulator